MGHSYIEYKGNEFYASDGLIDYSQKILLYFLKKRDLPDWISPFVELIELEIEMDMTRSFYLEESFDDKSKVDWFGDFLRSDLLPSIENISNEEFGSLIEEKVHPDVDLKKVYQILSNMELLLNKKVPKQIH